MVYAFSYFGLGHLMYIPTSKLNTSLISNVLLDRPTGRKYIFILYIVVLQCTKLDLLLLKGIILMSDVYITLQVKINEELMIHEHLFILALYK